MDPYKMLIIAFLTEKFIGLSCLVMMAANLRFSETRNGESRCNRRILLGVELAKIFSTRGFSRGG